LDVLLQEQHLTSWKISGSGDSTVVVLRLKASPANNSNMAQQHTPVISHSYRRKPPSQTDRDRRRTEERRRTAQRQEEQEASESAMPQEHSPVLFVPTPPTSCAVSHTDTPPSASNTLPQEAARAIRQSPSAVKESENEKHADVQRDIDLAPVFTTETSDCDDPLAKVQQVGTSVDVIKNYVAKLTDRSLQRKLFLSRHRNQNFSKVFSSKRHPDTMVSETDDLVFRFQWTAADDTPPDLFWFVKRNSRLMTNEESCVYQKLKLWCPVDREKMKDRISAGLDVMHVIVDAVRFLLG